MLSAILLCLVSGLAFVWYNLFSNVARMKRIAANMPRPKEFPFIGAALEFGSTSDTILQAYFRFSKLGPVVQLWIGPELYVLLSDIKDIELILQSNTLLKKAHIYDLLHPWLGNGLLSSTGEVWRKQRKILTPAFHFKPILEEFCEVFHHNIETLVGKIKKQVGSPGFNISPYISLCSLDIVAESSMGTTINAQVQSDSKFVTAIGHAAFITLYRALRPWLLPDILFKLSPSGRLYYEQVKVIHDFVDQVVRKRIEERKAGIKVVVDLPGESVYSKKRKALFLDTLLNYNDNGIGLSDEEIKNQVNTIMFAGYDTTTSSVSFILYALMKYPEIQEKVHKELTDLLESADSVATYEDYQNMKYLDCVIKETMRIYSIVPYVGRKAEEDVVLPSGYTVPAGASINMFLYGLHLNEERFPDPTRFDPERFNDEQSTDRSAFAFCPFSAGPRNCIGQKFAMLEVKAIVSAIVRNFKILAAIDCPEPLIGSELVLVSRTGIYLRFENR
ncbi:cytochrome P450 4C1 [Nilaparvata lugens]|uniref:Cytochrome P450 CYP4DC1 n=1 Tax=Nilaparvata lugens TaxID=108931 RepID=A0A0K0LBB2_NILLU|nr:cytochrome P450 4C1 [Nilaparvata lugens]XP_039288723.1 cytochrome P450 4C1 [Nilaparvata lugens]AIW80006.1 cytochrome P450 CYP4DC1 [Nilaparvata lugens]